MRYTVSDIAQRVIYEDNHLLVINKPVALATMGTSSNEDSLHKLACLYVKEKYRKPGAVYLGVVSRLDLPVSGVVVFARTSKAASRLNEQFRNHTIQKIYYSLVEGTLRPDSLELVNFICEDKVTQKLWITLSPKNVTGHNRVIKEARLRYKVIEKFSSSTLVEVELLTGRKHQIRLQLAHCGTPIIGDGKYGAKPIKEPGICLHASQLILTHPTTKEVMNFNAQIPDWKKWM